MSEPYCLKCKKVFKPYQCADANAQADLHQCRAIVKCEDCGTKNRIYKVVEYRVLKIVKENE